MDTRRTCDLDLAVCVLFYEKLDQTVQCIRSFLPSGVTIYVLNNGSSSSSRMQLGQFCKKYGNIQIFDSEVNLGVGMGRNYMITHTTEEWLLFVDNDIIVKTSDWLQKFVRHASSHYGTEVFVPRLYNKHERRYASYRSLRIDGRNAFHDVMPVQDQLNAFPGGASLINRNLFERLGLYDEGMFVGFEDFELCIRAILMGEPVKAKLIHDVELVHCHKKVKRPEDKNSVLSRYDIDLLESSFRRMTAKHNIVLESSWRKWASNQIDKKRGGHRQIPGAVWKQFVPRPIKRAWSELRARAPNIRNR